MKAQEIDLSPRGILKYLVDLEKRLSRREYKEYKASVLTKSPVTEDMLNSEARLMLDFVGLKHCTPKCTLCDVEENTGGSINLNSDSVVNIYVSNEFKNNYKAAVAVLAHEICHKLLYSYNIYFPYINIVNEVYTDLCTIYIGFGQLVIDGYITQNVKTTFYLGYLNFNVYKSAFDIIRATKGNYKEIKIEEIDDYYIQKTVGYLQRYPTLRKSFLEAFKLQQEKTALLRRNFTVLNSIIGSIQKKNNNNLAYLSDQFFGNSCLFDIDGTPLLPLHIFSILYETTLKLDEDNLFLSEKKSTEVLDELIVKLIDCNENIDISDDSVYSCTCPVCGCAVDSKGNKGRSTILKCPECNKYIYLNCTEFCVVGTRRRIKEKEDAYVDSLVQQRIVSVRSEAFNRGVMYANADNKKRLNAAIESMPFWLRWIVNKYIK